MIEGKTSTGFEYLIDESRLDDQELLDYFNANYLSIDRIVFTPEAAADGTVSEQAIQKATEDAEVYKRLLEKGDSIGDLAKKYAQLGCITAGVVDYNCIADRYDDEVDLLSGKASDYYVLMHM